MHIFLCFTEICIPFLVLEDLHPRGCILIKWICLYRRMKREITEIGEYRFWVSHLLCSVCLSCPEYTHIVYNVRLFARIIFLSWLHHAWGHYPFDVRRNLHSSMSVSCKTLIVCHPLSIAHRRTTSIVVYINISIIDSF